MHIRITDARRGVTYEVLCDVCGEAIGLDENCDYLTMRNGVSREAKIAHSPCARIPGRFKNHWTQMMKPIHIIQNIADQNRNPIITNLLRQLKEDKKERLNRP
jgi:hypothetical protein